MRIAYDAEKQVCSFTALQAIKKGDLVSVGVGLTSNLELLANRGTPLDPRASQALPLNPQPPNSKPPNPKPQIANPGGMPHP